MTCHPASMTDGSARASAATARSGRKSTSRKSWSCWGCIAIAAGTAYSQSRSCQRCGSSSPSCLIYRKSGDVLCDEVLSQRPGSMNRRIVIPVGTLGGPSRVATCPAPSQMAWPSAWSWVEMSSAQVPTPETGSLDAPDQAQVRSMRRRFQCLAECHCRATGR